MSAISDGLQFSAAMVAVFGGAGALYKYAAHHWRQTIGRRRTQADILDQLCCTSSLEFIESKLGAPQFITYHFGREERIYRLPGAWVIVHAVAGAVHWFSITITDPAMYYEIGPTTLGNLPIQLGVTTFAEAPSSDHESVQIGARDATFVRYYDYGCTARGGQAYWLAYNSVGCGEFSDSGRYGTGTYASSGIQYGTSPDTSGITANTLTVMSPVGDPNDMRERSIHGPHHDHVKLAVRRKVPPLLTRILFTTA